MLLFWFLVLAISVINCDYVSENYILEMPDGDIPKDYNTTFKVYWNVPTRQCRYKKNSIPFDDILRKYSITYNKNDAFEGETITIIYDGGFIPSVLKRDGARYSIRNGGLPQEGDLELHLTAFRETVNRLIPDPNFKGVGVIDMECWRPIFRQHWSGLASIIDLSMSIEKRKYWWWPNSWVKMEATKRFEDAARAFMQKTLSTAKQMRPKAVWGYYGFPYCFNMDKNMEEHCSKETKQENDRTYWLWAESTALYPSLYSTSQFSTSQLEALVRGRLVEANRVKNAGVLVLPYFWIKYRDGGYFKEQDLIAIFETLMKKKASGLIIWGSSNDVNQTEKCKQLIDYINSILGPIAKKYIQKINKAYDTKIKVDTKTLDVSNSTFNYTINITTTTHKPILNSNNENIPIKNIITINNIITIDQKQLNKYFYETVENKTDIKRSNESDIWDIIPYQYKPTLNSNKENTPINNIITTEKSKNISHIIEQEQLTKYFYETGENKTNIKKSNESDIWNIISYQYKPILNSNKENTHLNNPITTEKSKNISHITEQEQLNKYFYETGENKTDIKKSNESDIWDIIPYQYKPTLNSNKENTLLNNPITTEKSENISHITEHKQLNKYFYETGENKADINRSNESDIWHIISFQQEYSTESNKNREPCLNSSTSNKMISNKNNSIINNDVYITEKISSDSTNLFKNISDNLFKVIENSTSSTISIKNLTKINILNLTETSIIMNITDITTENNPEFIQIIEPEQKQKKYYYETDSNKTNIVICNKSDICNLVAHKENQKEEQENNTESIKSAQYTGDIESFNHTESNYINTTKINETIFNENNSDLPIATIENTVQNILNDSATSVVNVTKSINSSENINTTYLDTEATIRIEKNMSDDSFKSVGNDTGIIEKIKSGNNLDLKLLLANNYSKDISENVKEDEQLITNTNYPNTESSLYTGDISDYLVILTEETDPMDNINDTRKNENGSRNIEQEKQLNKNSTYSEIEATSSKENDISDYLIILTKGSSPSNTSMTVNDTDKEEEYDESDEKHT